MKDEAPVGSAPGDEQAFRVAYLVAGFIRNTLTAVEQVELDDWVTANMENQRLFEQLIDEKNIEEGLRKLTKTDTSAALEKVKKRIGTSPAAGTSFKLIWYSVAACLLVVAGIALLLLYKKPFVKPPDMVETKPADLAPGAARAMLTLADGRTIQLDSLHTGSIPVPGNTHISKTDSGELAYAMVQPSTLPQAEWYNTLNVPAGGEYKVVLPDGTKVWLNAASSLKYPTVFGGSRRVVELSGEAYFEVAKNPLFPFVVKVNGTTVQVLGTHFNINAYNDQSEVKVVLVEGSVKFNSLMVLKPGEFATLAVNGRMARGSADTTYELAWKNGQFMFKEETIDEIMRQVARWYNAEIVYKDNITEHFRAHVSRGEPVSKLLHLLEATNAVHFAIDNKKITVMK